MGNSALFGASYIQWIGPVPGDILEVEAYCRIFRATERLHTTLMETPCNPLTGECSVSYDFTPEEKPVTEDKIVNEMKSCCESLHVALENYLTPDDYRSLHVWRKLQRLKNACYDLGCPRKDNHPCHTLFAN
ncbi:hypothetical protein ERO13_A05G341300v2 [Gossypium hirsutum]|uniref:Uncharacterized protein n=1 Tax=Gossypium barbadense TaxID=3634 RepID=A0A5J5VYX7_GOSBA|nr:hypothetical protein ES319_A05G359600v1 [Gossypium barbadense]KAG4202488.1 hypothetical protein ERO13_A05G341300v2 [Gossypium hirsutum]